ncbi:hypothetical protein BA893_04975 [Vibrio natriegens]|uniref:hypothetical protein n=1 Tax=Vibrio natriegens TaxID=691 RepID=UPI0008043078|nr:hypothetical protein [Vibrio natriegens]ANQ21048.1 hypothetical protein BA893_04975 [Vibrio natriegens]
MKKRYLIVPSALLFLAGCSTTDFYQVQSQFRVNDAGEDPASVTRARGFDAEFNNIEVIAVKAPDRCISETETQSTGRATSASTVMKTECGVEMAQIERELAKAGYSVISWKILQNQMTASSTHLEAANSLGADALFQINSLERTTSAKGQDARWDRRYFKSDAKGIKGVPASVKEDTANRLNTIASYEEKVLVPSSDALSATINANVTLVKNARNIWFYDWSHQEAIAEDGVIEHYSLVRCSDETDYYVCLPYVAKVEQSSEEALVQGSSQGFSRTVNLEDQKRYKHDLLMKEVISDMVKNFSN